MKPEIQEIVPTKPRVAYEKPKLEQLEQFTMIIGASI